MMEVCFILIEVVVRAVSFCQISSLKFMYFILAVFVFCCSVTNCCTLRGFKNHKNLLSEVLEVRSPNGPHCTVSPNGPRYTKSPNGPHHTKSKVSAGLYSLWRLQRRIYFLTFSSLLRLLIFLGSGPPSSILKASTSEPSLAHTTTSCPAFCFYGLW